MKHVFRGAMLAVAGLAMLWTGTALAGATDAQKCQADKIKRAGKYAFCRMKTEAKAVNTGDPEDFSKCDSKLLDKFNKAEGKWGVECPTSGDYDGIKNQVTADTDWLALKLAGERFIDNGDGTVTDTQTGLMWEQKTDDGSVHDWDNFYTWSISGTDPDGTAFVDFLGELNNCVDDGTDPPTGVTGGFAGHCDWRLPTILELQTIVDCGFGNPCIDPIFGPTQSYFYWSSTTYSLHPFGAWDVQFSDGDVWIESKNIPYDYVRAVRGGL